MYRVEWDDFEGNQHERLFETLKDAKLEAAYLKAKYDFIKITKEETRSTAP